MTDLNHGGKAAQVVAWLHVSLHADGYLVARTVRQPDSEAWISWPTASSKWHLGKEHLRCCTMAGVAAGRWRGQGLVLVLVRGLVFVQVVVYKNSHNSLNQLLPYLLLRFEQLDILILFHRPYKSHLVWDLQLVHYLNDIEEHHLFVIHKNKHYNQVEYTQLG